MTRTHASKACLTLLVLVAGALALAPTALAQEEERGATEEKSYRFEFEMDDHPMDLHDFAVHFEPPDLSGLEDLHLSLREPLRFLSGFEHGRFAEERLEVAELERESRELARQIGEAEGSERQRLEADLRSKLEEIFEKKLELRRDRVARLEEELRDEREKLRRRTEAREEMIDRRLHELVGEEDVLEW